MKLQRWRYRHRAFKLGFCGLLFSLTLSCIGYIAPAWQNTGGLWIFQRQTDVDALPVWFQGVRALETICLVALLLSVAVEISQDVCHKYPPASDNLLVEILAILAGLCGLTGEAVFGAKVTKSYPPGWGPFADGPTTDKPLFWAWGLQVVGSAAAVASGLVMGCSRLTNRARTERKLRVAAFRKTVPRTVGLHPYFVSRGAMPAVRIVPATVLGGAGHPDSVA